MLNYFKNFFRRQSIKDIAIFQTSSSANQIINALSSIILARILGPTKYGVYSLIFIFISLVTIADINFNKTAIVLLPEAYAAKNKEEVRKILTYLFKIRLYVYLPIYAFLIMAAPLLTDYLYQNRQIGELARLILAAAYLSSFTDILNLNLESRREIKSLALVENSTIFLKNLLPIAFILLGLEIFGLALGYALALIIISLTSFIIYWIWSRKDEYLPPFSFLIKNLNNVKITYNFNFNFSMILDNKLGNFWSGLPLLILSLITGPAIISFWKIAYSYVTLPLVLLGSISRLLNIKFPQDKVKDIDLLKKNFYFSSLITGLIYIILSLPFIFLARYLIPFFYGSEFNPAVKISYWLAISFISSGFGIGFGPIYRAARKIHLSVIFSALRALTGILIFISSYFIFKFSGLTSVLFFQLFISLLCTPFHFWYVKRLVIEKIK